MEVFPFSYTHAHIHIYVYVCIHVQYVLFVCQQLIEQENKSYFPMVGTPVRVSLLGVTGRQTNITNIKHN